MRKIGRWFGLESLAEGRPVVVLGGDHGVTPPILGALARRHSELALVVLDAHPDLFDSYDGRRDSHACAVARAWETPGLGAGRTALVGLRSYGRPELDELGRAGLAVPAVEWARRGSAEIARRVAACADGRPVHLSLDIDVLDPAAAPGTREVMDLMRHLWGRMDIVSLDLVEVAPPLDPAQVTVATAAHLLLHAFGLWARDGKADA